MREDQKKGYKKYALLLVLLLLFVSVGYAVLNTTLNINGTSTVGKVSWDVHFENLQEVTGSVTPNTKAAIDGAATTITYDISLAEPGDFYSFTVDVVNDGSLTAKLATTPVLGGLSEEQAKYIIYDVYYDNDNADSLQANDTIEAGSSSTIVVEVMFNPDVTADVLPTAEQTLNLTLALNYVQG